ncbi:formate/nitrite transporter family protein [Sphingomonas sp.]
MATKDIDPAGPAIAAAAPELLGGKANGAWMPMIVLAILAGAFIGFGSIGFLIAQAVGGASGGATQLLSGLAFSVGLILVMLTGAELFTGNTMFVLPAVRGILTPGRVLAAWSVVWLGNLGGSVALAILFVVAGGGDGVDGRVADAAIEVATGKVDKNVGALLASAVLANTLVCLAVWCSMAARSVPSKVLGIVGPITLFVAAGLEHSIANQSLLPIAWLLQNDGTITLAGIVRNLAWSTMGNIIGGATVALTLGYAHHGDR